MTNRKIDQATGTETTGHEWDGIRELDTPMPRWWLILFYITIIWAIGYMIFYPAIPLISSNTKGTLGYSSRAELEDALKNAQSARAQQIENIRTSSLAEIKADQSLHAFALAGGKAAFKVNCVQCHGSGAEGSKGNPNLNDDDWLWGGKLEDIHQTIKHGVRFELDDDTRSSEMPAFGRDEMLTQAEIEAVADYVLSLATKPADKMGVHENSGEETAGGTDNGAQIFADNCAACHGTDGGGDRSLGAPSLNDHIWLYGGDKRTVIESIFNSRKAVMPAWTHRLDEVTIKQLALYVHSLGGGE